MRNEHNYIDPFNLIDDKVESLLEQGSPILPFIYPAIKKHISESLNGSFPIGKQQQELGILVENFIFKIFGLNNIISDVSVLDYNSEPYSFYESVYSQIEILISNMLLPNDRLNFIRNTITSIRRTLDDELGKDYTLLQDSIPRRLLRVLENEFETIKANPKIDLKDFDRNKIKPIKVDLTVPQLALLFRLFEENGIVKLDIKKQEYYNTISKTFSSKRTDLISSNAFGNAYVDPEEKLYDFWKHKFFDLAKITKFHK